MQKKAAFIMSTTYWGKKITIKYIFLSTILLLFRLLSFQYEPRGGMWTARGLLVFCWWMPVLCHSVKSAEAGITLCQYVPSNQIQ